MAGRVLHTWPIPMALLVGGLTGPLIGPADHERAHCPKRQETARGRSALPRRLQAEGIENLYQLSARLYSGGQPEAKRGFAALQKLGIKTIISVDGAAPNVEAARHHGMRYVHLPIGYDGISRAQALRIVKAVAALPGPVYLHCHHGKHRGPAAAALACLALEHWSNEQAVAWLESAGTSPRYQGLYRVVRAFRRPDVKSLEAVSADFPQRAEVAPLAAAMVQIDAIWEHLRAIAQSGFRVPRDHPDLDPAHEALMLAEQFRELARSGGSAPRDATLHQRFRAAARDAHRLERAFRALAATPTPTARRAAAAAFAHSVRHCRSCHAQHRN